MKKVLPFGLVIILLALIGLALRTVSQSSRPGGSPAPASQPAAVRETPTDVPAAAAMAEVAELDHLALLNQLLTEARSSADARPILNQIAASGDLRFVGALIDTLRWRRDFQVEVGQTLNSLTAESLPPDWFVWVEWFGKRPDIESFADYAAWKSQLFAGVDPNFTRFIYDGVEVAPGSRLEEVVWGGVRVDGIPALDNPTMIDPAEADYLEPNERVFGVSLKGDTRAYPARFLDWHEMFNDVVGGEPVSLAY